MLPNPRPRLTNNLDLIIESHVMPGLKAFRSIKSGSTARTHLGEVYRSLQ